MTYTESETVSFQVSGEALTRIVRDMMLSGEPDRAWRTALACFPKDARAMDVTTFLDGRTRLRNLNAKAIIRGGCALKIVADRSESGASYRKELRHLYAGRVRINGTWWRPVREITKLGDDDMAFARRKLGLTPEDSEDVEQDARFTEVVNEKRVSYYADSGERPVQVQGHDLPLIFESVGPPPFWWDPIGTPEGALKEFVDEGWALRPDGADHRFSEDAITALEEEEGAERREQERRTFRAELLATRAREIAESREEIVKQAGTDWYTLILEDGNMVRVPRAPFFHWALSRTPHASQAPAWQTVSGSGWRLMFDDPNHTDWIIGSGNDLAGYQGSPLQVAADAARYEIQSLYSGHDCAILVQGPIVTGQIGTDIVVLPDLHPFRLPDILEAKAVITEAGGAMAHLAQVALERRVPMVRVAKAFALYPKGTWVQVDATDGCVRIVQDVKGRS